MTVDLQHAASFLRMVVYGFGVVAVVEFMLLPTCASGLRQKLFALRHELFLLMADGKLRPNDPVYGYLRSTINGMIRFSERITFSRLVLGSYLLKRAGEDYDRQFRLMVAQHPADVAAALASIRQRAGYEVLRYIAKTSYIVWLLFGPVIAVRVIQKRRQAAVQLATGKQSPSPPIIVEEAGPWRKMRVRALRATEAHARCLAAQC